MATRAAVVNAYTAFFSSKSTLRQSMAALQHGPAFRKELVEEGNSSNAETSSAKVTSVELVSPDVAVVKYSVISGGITMLPNVTGNAVKENGTWKLAAATFCGLLQLEGKSVAACNDPKIVGLPS